MLPRCTLEKTQKCYLGFKKLYVEYIDANMFNSQQQIRGTKNPVQYFAASNREQDVRFDWSDLWSTALHVCTVRRLSGPSWAVLCSKYHPTLGMGQDLLCLSKYSTYNIIYHQLI